MVRCYVLEVMCEVLEVDLWVVFNGVLNMFGIVEWMLLVVVEVLLYEWVDLLGEVCLFDCEVDVQEVQFEVECLCIIVLYQLVVCDLWFVVLIFKSFFDIECMGDYVVYVVEDGVEFVQVFVFKKYVNFLWMFSCLIEMSQNLWILFVDCDVICVENIIWMDDEVDEFYEQIQCEFVIYMFEDFCNIFKVLMFMWVGCSLEWVGDYMENVVECVCYWVMGLCE